MLWTTLAHAAEAAARQWGEGEGSQQWKGPMPLLPRGWACVWPGGGMPPPALPCNSPSRPWPDGFQMLSSQQRPPAPPKATALASS